MKAKRRKMPMSARCEPTGKVGYLNINAAYCVAKELRQTRGRMYPYHCCFCCLYHLGHSKAKDKERAEYKKLKNLGRFEQSQWLNDGGALYEKWDGER